VEVTGLLRSLGVGVAAQGNRLELSLPMPRLLQVRSADQAGLRRWQGRVQRWVAGEGAWLAARLAAEPGLEPLPSAANYLLVRSRPPAASLQPLRLELERRHRILVRDCRSFEGLGEDWLRIAVQDRAGNRRLLAALEQISRGR
jgi:histidinol-phosphate/aromatic aminotransferase/cobyric acid decarboxylase-like protein